MRIIPKITVKLLTKKRSKPKTPTIRNNQKSKLIIYLKNALKKKKITKNHQVIYNISQAKIVSIPKLELNNDKFSIN